MHTPTSPRSTAPSRRTPSPPQRGASQQPALLQKLPGGVGVATPSAPNAVALQIAVFGALAAWALAGALLEGPEAQAADTGGLQLALAGAFSIYQLRDAKRVSIGAAQPARPHARAARRARTLAPALCGRCVHVMVTGQPVAAPALPGCA
jgi:hypothetical protein